MKMKSRNPRSKSPSRGQVEIRQLNQPMTPVERPTLKFSRAQSNAVGGVNGLRWFGVTGDGVAGLIGQKVFRSTDGIHSNV